MKAAKLSEEIKWKPQVIEIECLAGVMWHSNTQCKTNENNKGRAACK